MCKRTVYQNFHFDRETAKEKNKNMIWLLLLLYNMQLTLVSSLDETQIISTINNNSIPKINL